MRKASIYCYAGLTILFVSCLGYALGIIGSIFLYIGAAIASLCILFANEIYKKKNK